MKLNSDQNRRCQCQFNFPPRHCVPIFFLLITPAQPFASKFCVPNFWVTEFLIQKTLRFLEDSVFQVLGHRAGWPGF